MNGQFSYLDHNAKKYAVLATMGGGGGGWVDIQK